MVVYRKNYFEHYKGKKKLFRKERYYKCVFCGRELPRSQIQVDHRIPKRKGGTDDWWNLQAACEDCNLAKGADQSDTETRKSYQMALLHGGFLRLKASMALRKWKDDHGIRYKRRDRICLSKRVKRFFCRAILVVAVAGLYLAFGG
jgi:hypothetical protein